MLDSEERKSIMRYTDILREQIGILRVAEALERKGRVEWRTD